MKEIKNCPGCLKTGYNTYCRTCLKRMFNGKKVSHILPFSRPEFNQVKREQSGKISISGIQIKHSLKLNNKTPELTDKDGQYILKPVPTGTYLHLNEVPANEQLTMQIARQIYGINTAENAIIFFNDGEPAYLTKRFDVLTDGCRLLQEDFAQIAGRTEETHGKNYKYDFSYEEIAFLMKQHVKAYLPEVEKYFQVILFNYLFSNGDSHLKNFSLTRNEEFGDYLLTPFYDLLDTSIHVPEESDLALDLFKDNFESETYKAGTKYTGGDFIELGRRMGMLEIRIKKIFQSILSEDKKVYDLIRHSFLPDEIKTIYKDHFINRLKRLDIGT